MINKLDNWNIINPKLYKIIVLKTCFLLTTFNGNTQNLPELGPKIYENTRILENLIRTIADKNVDKKIRQNAKDQVLELFISDQCKIQVMSKRMKKPETYTIRDYLTRIYTYGYKDVNIEWKYINIIEDVKQKDDGFYYGKLRIYQLFEGTGSRPYKDITEKDIEIKLEKKYIESGRKINDSYFEVRFGDISVHRLLDDKEIKEIPKPKNNDNELVKP